MRLVCYSSAFTFLLLFCEGMDKTSTSIEKGGLAGSLEIAPVGSPVFRIHTMAFYLAEVQRRIEKG